ncbi:hypothetical protein [Parasphingorhabdus sp.]|uniref:hypothetical protein n=1 Tax=Parasphingorhabdus sp. TaxID=2709688 RepID=UPI0030036AFB
MVGELFDDYIRKTDRNRGFLSRVEKVLDELSINYKKLGRDFVKKATEADLIIVDLYLGTAQQQADRDRTVEGLREIIKVRQTPPSIILMSQLALHKKAPELRNEVGLHASGFRGVQKKDIEKSARLRGLIVGLAAHRDDSQKLAEFTRKWNEGTLEAVKKTATELRRIDIDDLHHIKTLLLASEGLRASSYMLDVLDRVLQFEIEANGEILAAAAALDKVSEKPAPLTIAHDKDSFRLIERTVFQNPNRRQQVTGAVWPITFGDILVSASEKNVSKTGIFKGDANKAFFVASPECDFIRGNKLTTALLISGELLPLEMGNIVLVSKQSTPILDLGKRGRFQINWDFGHLETITLQRAKNLVAKNGPAKIAATLRDVSALSLRQQFAERFGAIGLLASPPRSFKLTASCHIPLKTGDFKIVEIGADNTLTGTMIINPNGKMAHIVFDYAHEADFIEALLAIEINSLAAQSKAMVEKLGQQGFAQQLFRTGFSDLKYPLKPSQDGKLVALGERTDSSGNLVKEKVGTIMKATQAAPVIDAGKHSSVGLLFHISADQ